MLVNDPTLTLMIEKLSDKYHEFYEALSSDEPCIDIIRVLYEMERTVKLIKKEIMTQHVHFCHSNQCNDIDAHNMLIDDIKTLLNCVA
ncbi:hypothetical protein UXO16_20385 [Enterobacter hormaechei]|uniref:Uncharacterized protein n=1 Tax=Enterobacter ludwigii TaxID=299767 RepID=A0AAX3LK10_9ENTR|nr:MULTISPECIES: hypothetical protein [Enterobacter cloacae complex]MCW4755626.1 hypothetical protein [Enterobacter hormaechei]WCE15976.1 hypothetical protein PHA72_26955 [Enterobacter ludwigii]